MTEYRTELQEAFAEWVALMPCHQRISSQVGKRMNRFGEMITIKIPPTWDGNCCSSSHFGRGNGAIFVSLADAFVCDRERAWRKYVEIRDRVH